MKIFAIGDIHGMYGHMKRAVEFIEANIQENDEVVFLGDYVDRGPDSAACLEMVKNLNKRKNWYFLAGNHEDMMIDPFLYTTWLMNGGYQTLESLNKDNLSLEDAQDIIRKNTILKHRNGRFVFVHAGVYPFRELHKQKKDDLQWIRTEFLEVTDEDILPDVEKAFIVHGHTPVKEPFIRKNGAGIDLGCFATNKLCVAIIDTEEDSLEIKIIKDEEDV